MTVSQRQKRWTEDSDAFGVVVAAAPPAVRHALAHRRPDQCIVGVTLE